MSDTRLHAIPVFGRYGFTHGLLAWARCRLWCEQTDATMLARVRPGVSIVPIDTDPTSDIESTLGETIDPAFVSHARTRLGGQRDRTP